jgi:hypothetical protein
MSKNLKPFGHVVCLFGYRGSFGQGYLLMMKTERLKRPQKNSLGNSKLFVKRAATL